jgi:hypothetical protein
MQRMRDQLEREVLERSMYLALAEDDPFVLVILTLVVDKQTTMSYLLTRRERHDESHGG